MKADISRRIYAMQKGARFIPLTFVMKDGRRFHGVIAAFKFGEPAHGETFITQWHLVPVAEAMNGGRGPLGAFTGELIFHADIDYVICADGTRIQISNV